jgi:hypothetical protein
MVEVMLKMKGKVEKVVTHKTVKLRKGSQGEGWITVYAEAAIREMNKQI